MTKDDAQAAINGAFCDGVKRIFGILACNLIDQPPAQASAEFFRGVQFHLRAHAIATTALEDAMK